MDKNKIIQDYKNGMTISEIASKLHVATSTISGFIKPLNLPTNKIIKKIINYPGFKEFLLIHTILHLLQKIFVIFY